jgi:hypothetical protein
MSTLTLSRVMIPFDWIGIVTIRSDTRTSRSITGMISARPGSLTPTTLPSRNSTPLWYCVTTFTDSENAKWPTPCTSIDRVDLIVLDSRRPRGPRRQRAGSTDAQAI